MSDLFVALGLVLVIEGLIWALSPDLGRRLLATAMATPEQTLSKAGWVAVAVGAYIVWMVRG
jgi:uncharacterized protein YjeT (DUF2065 family)